MLTGEAPDGTNLLERVLQPAVGGLIWRAPLSQVNNPDLKDKNLANGRL